MSDADEKRKPTYLSPAQIAYYQKLATDLNRYRNFRWYIPIWTVSFLGAVSWAMGAGLPGTPNVVRICASFVICGVAFLSIWNLWNCYTCYAENREAVLSIEHEYELLALGLQKWRDRAKHPDGRRRSLKRHTVFKWGWFVLITLVALYALYRVWPHEVGQFLSWLAAGAQRAARD